MELVFKSRLPENIQRLVNKIESQSKCEINVKAMKINDPLEEVKPMQITISYKHAELGYDPRNSIDPNSVLHELLHLERFWIKKIPQLQPINPKNKGMTANIDNQYEHLIIIPMEQKYGYKSNKIWENKLSMLIENGFDEKEHIQSKMGKMLFGYIQGILLEYDAILLHKLEELIIRYGLLENVKKYTNVILANIEDKRQCILKILEFLNIPAEETYFETLLIHEKRSIRYSVL